MKSIWISFDINRARRTPSRSPWKHSYKQNHLWWSHGQIKILQDPRRISSHCPQERESRMYLKWLCIYFQERGQKAHHISVQGSKHIYLIKKTSNQSSSEVANTSTSSLNSIHEIEVVTIAVVATLTGHHHTHPIAQSIQTVKAETSVVVRSYFSWQKQRFT